MSAAFVWDKKDLIRCSSNDSPTIPHRIKSLDGVEIRNISSGQNHTLVCLKDGTVRRCVHDSKQCGSESIWSKLGDLNRVNGLPNKTVVIQVAAGSSHSVLLTREHKVYTWGQNDQNQLGRNVHSQNKRKVPRLVKSLAKYTVVQIACGNNHTLALTDGGLVFAWGSNTHGQLGFGIAEFIEIFDSKQQLPQVISCLKGIPVMQIAAGGNHSFILSKSGTLYGWGKNDVGQLGLENTEALIFEPKECKLITDKKIKYICCGENHTACLTMDGCVYTFGSGRNFQFGHCCNKNESAPKKIMELLCSEVSQIACGSDHTVAFVPKSGIIYVFGQSRNGPYILSSTENSTKPVSISHPFVLSGQDKLSYLSMKLDNQEPDNRIKSIYAGGNQSFIVTVPSNTCDSDDFRIENPTNQILTLSEERIRKLQLLSTEDTLCDDEIGKIFSSPSCLNGSFLLPNDEHYESVNKSHGVNMMAVREFFQALEKNPKLLDFINTQIREKLIPDLPTSLVSDEALRLYLILPECHLFEKPEFYSSILCQFAKNFLSQNSSVFDSWWPSNQQSFFKKLVVCYKKCLEYLLQLPFPANSHEDIERKQCLINSLEMLQKLYQVNQGKGIIDDITFIVPNLKDFVSLSTAFFLAANIPNQNQLFYNYPFVLDVESKSILLQVDSCMQQMSLQRYIDMQCGRILQPPTNYCFSLNIDRKNLVSETLLKKLSADNPHLKLPLTVQFDGEKATGSGVVKEFFRLLFCKIMSPDFGLFTTDDESKLLWFKNKTEYEPEMFCKIGILCGLVIYNSVAIDLHFPLALYKKLLKKPVTLNDVTELMPGVGLSLQSLLEFEDDNFEDTFNLTFEWETNTGECVKLEDDDEDAEQEQMVEDAKQEQMVEDAKQEQMVNQKNKNKYVALCVDYLLNKSVVAKFKAFSKGFHSVCGGKILDSFRPEELRFLVEGNDDYDFSVLETNTIYEGVYYPKHPTIIFFWEVFHELSLANKKKFLLFLTGSDRFPVTGMMNIQICIQPLDGEQLFPNAYTCFNRLLLPVYTTKEQLETNLLIAIQCNEGFSLT